MFGQLTKSIILISSAILGEDSRAKEEIIRKWWDGKKEIQINEEAPTFALDIEVCISKIMFPF